MVIFWIYFGAPAITGQPIDGWTAALLAMSIIAASYLAEVIRAGLYSVDEPTSALDPEMISEVLDVMGDSRRRA